ncbi:histone-like transcription factor and archaeal histone [Drepanopeziza brunnea f. sp. 'multigermtubi' MB_m1]|uniref:Histone-like transcription factor and archaeal histone n=1 Tax=Marssonina brunnea f. sp. multigermtubi (strain MB_m1) TaxID=1072389 RepID=K1WZD9_MARBU|nr:histone-like transcription factor and archaeal histone [Drepanopeziza brunnea f. sp. 'multigermtubi' MB_m1]EKD18007.1 histone-like transcription factor and archaeal histone [Drepanopeziza brunnea f. sp. 'multigermtubi' MB_m1]
MDQQPPSSSHGQQQQGVGQHQHQQQQQQQQRSTLPRYDIGLGGHYGASSAIAAQGFAPVADFYTGAWANVNQGLHGNYKDILTTYWQHVINHLETEAHDYKLHQLPLARIKKVMKADPDVKMISAEAPILFAKGCDIFITELTMRAWIHAEENKRRTLQRSDIASALAKSDMFDFLIDIVPRDDAAHGGGTKRAQGHAPPSAPVPGTQLPQQNIPQQGHMPPPEYGAIHGLGQEQDYRQQPNMYGGQVQAGPSASYGGAPQQGMYGDMEGIYGGYPPMPPQQNMYQMPSQHRPQDPSIGPDPGHNYSRHDGGEGEADAEGERDDFG